MVKGTGNSNPLLLADPNVDGMKTGFVRQAGYGVVVTIRQNGRRLIAVVNGAAGENDAFLGFAGEWIAGRRL